MEISKNDIQKIKIFGEMREKDIFFELGKALIIAKRGSSSQSLGKEFTEDELIRISNEYFRENQGDIRKIFCKEWKSKGKEDLKDSTLFISTLVSAIFQATNIAPNYINIAIPLASLVIKRGIDTYCLDIS